MFILRSTYNQLVARADMHAEAARDARRVEQAAVNSTARIAQRMAARELAHEKELAARDRRIAHLQARLDAAVGLDAPNLDLGAKWQERRSDKPRPAVKP